MHTIHPSIRPFRSTLHGPLTLTPTTDSPLSPLSTNLTERARPMCVPSVATSHVTAPVTPPSLCPFCRHVTRHSTGYTTFPVSLLSPRHTSQHQLSVGTFIGYLFVPVEGMTLWRRNGLSRRLRHACSLVHHQVYNTRVVHRSHTYDKHNHRMRCTYLLNGDDRNSRIRYLGV